MNTHTFHKTLLALVICGACASTLGADIAVSGNASSNSQSAAQIQDNQLAVSGNQQNSAAVQASIDKAALSTARAQTENSAQSVIALGSSAKETTENEIQSAQGTVAATVESDTSGDLTVSTLDGIAIELTGNSDNSIAAQVNSAVDSSVTQSAESAVTLGETALGTTLNVLGNTASSAEEIGNAVDVSAAAESSTEATSAMQFDEASVGAVESASDASTSTSLVGGLL